MNRNQASRIFIAVVLLLVSQLACQALFPSPSTPTPTASATLPSPTNVLPSPIAAATESTNFSDEEIKAGIQTSLNIYAEAYRENKPELLYSVVDGENKPFRRIVRSRFDDFQSSYQAGEIRFRFQVLEINKREHGFVLARFETDGGYEAEWPFRYLNGSWVISEPSVEQIGEPVKTETEHFIFTSYPWADDVNSSIIDLTETARKNVEAVLGKVPAEKANVEILPIYGLHPFDPMNAIALYSEAAKATDDTIQIYTPNSFSYSFYDPELGWKLELEQTLTHEYTHMTQVRSFNDAGDLADWMSEGLAEYVSGAKDQSLWACDAMKSGTFIPIVDETRTVYQQDLMHMYLLEENFGLSYDFAASLVEFTVEKYGGLNGFWKLAETLDETSNFEKAVQKAFGISYEEYNRQWQAWLKKKC